eukprot:GHVP01021220.1.p1 GENE.GHVP01021220.1~~GHVP01021220.1.p1  ORF type:complete len:141 (+),score=20.38 GHVP01021220.1:155-577(+)
MAENPKFPSKIPATEPSFRGKAPSSKEEIEESDCIEVTPHVKSRVIKIWFTDEPYVRDFKLELLDFLNDYCPNLKEVATPPKSVIITFYPKYAECHLSYETQTISRALDLNFWPQRFYVSTWRERLTDLMDLIKKQYDDI